MEKQKTQTVMEKQKSQIVMKYQEAPFGLPLPHVKHSQDLVLPQLTPFKGLWAFWISTIFPFKGHTSLCGTYPTFYLVGSTLIPFCHSSTLHWQDIIFFRSNILPLP